MQVNVAHVKREIMYFMQRTYAALYSLTHKIENKVLFCSFGGKQYSDNPRAISEKLHEMYPEHEIVWLLNNDEGLEGYIPEYVRTITSTDDHGRGFIEELATSFCFVTNNEMSTGIYKRSKQFFIQTYHADCFFKKVLYDAGFMKKIADSRVTDICIAGSDFGERKYRSAFHYYGDILKIGTPRNDMLVYPHKEVEMLIRERLGLHQNQHVLLYAPTFRDNLVGQQTINVDLSKVLDILGVNGGEWTCLVRAHKSSSGLSNTNTDERIIDATAYPDMADLLLIADFLITDYSSCAGDFALRKKPVILAVFDQEEYVSQCRALYFDLEKSGFYVAKNQDRLNQYLITLKKDDYERSCDNVMRYFGTSETGHSSEKICERIHIHYKQL